MTTTAANRAKYLAIHSKDTLVLISPERARLEYPTGKELNPSFAWNTDSRSHSDSEIDYDNFTEAFNDLLGIASRARVNDKKCLVISPLKFRHGVMHFQAPDNMQKNMKRAIDMVIERLGYHQVCFFWSLIYSEPINAERTPNDLVIWVE